MVKDIGVGSNPNSASYQLSSLCYPLFASVSPSLNMEMIINLPHNTFVRTQHDSMHEVLSTLIGASQVLAY